MKSILTFLAFFFLALSMSSQNYTLTVLNEAYVELAAPTSLNNGATWDDPLYAIPLQFNGEFFATMIDTMTILGLGSTLYDDIVDYYTSYDSNGIAFPFQADVIDLGYEDGTSMSDISYTVEGTPGNRILKIQWQNVGFYEQVTSGDTLGYENDFVNFQFWLYEATGVIRSHIGPNNVVYPGSAYDNGTGPLIALVQEFEPYGYVSTGNAITLSGDPASPTTSTTFDYYAYAGLNGTPVANTVYQFNPIAAAIEESHSLSDITLYPNPVDDLLNISGISAGIQVLEYTLYDIAGKKLGSGRVLNSSIKTDNLATGSYLLQLRNGADVMNKFIQVR